MKTLVISRFDLSQVDRPKASKIFGNFFGVLEGTSLVRGSSVWHHATEDAKFMRVTQYDSVEDYHSTYNEITESGQMKKAVLANKVVPDVQVYEVQVSSYHGVEHLHQAPFLSISDRIMPTRTMADEWLEKLRYNFEENAQIPGFHGCVLSRQYDVEEQIGGIALWRSAAAFKDSLPENVEYMIDLYQRIL